VTPAEGSTVDAGAVSKIAADRGAGFEPSVPVAREPPSVWKGQLGNSRTVERGQSQKSVVPLGGTEGSNPAPSSSESRANLVPLHPQGLSGPPHSVAIMRDPNLSRRLSARASENRQSLLRDFVAVFR
jgi:hypothetical protein